MPQPSCEEIKKLYESVISAKQAFDSEFVNAKASGFAVKEMNKRAVHEQDIVKALFNEWREKFRPFQLVQWDTKKIHRFEADALAVILDEINADMFEQKHVLGMRRPLKSPSFLKNKVVINNDSIETLDLSITGLSRIPPSIAKLANLEELILRSNPIIELIDLNPLKNLKRLSLSSTQIDDISPLDGLDSLEFLYLHGCPIDKDANAERIKYWQKLGDNFHI